jgi:hypothetical protein
MYNTIVIKLIFFLVNNKKFSLCNESTNINLTINKYIKVEEIKTPINIVLFF